MGNQPYELNPTGRERASGNRPPTIANLPAVPVPVVGAPRPASGSHQCPNCGAWTPIGSSICAECGVRLQPKPQKVRCRLCGANAPASLVICPQCGRELQPAPSRVLSWGAPVVLVVLALLIFAPRWESDNPFRWAQSGFGAGRSWVNEMAQRLDPQITISTLPETVAQGQDLDNTAILPTDNQVNPIVDGAERDSTGDQTPSNTTPLTGSQETNSQDAPADANQASQLMEAVIVTPTATLVEPTATTPIVAQPTATTATPQPTPTATIVPATPTSPPSVTATPRQPTPSAIVEAIPVVTTPDNTLVAANVITSSEGGAAGTILQPTATLPLPTPTPIPPTATATPAAVIYTVKAGDTPAEIAERYGITVNELLAVNGLSLNDARRLRVGQVLTIAAAATPAPSPTPTTAGATATPTLPAAPTATSTPPSAVRVDAPVLRSPENGSFLSCNSNNALIWLPVAYIRESDQYLLHLGFLSGYNGDGSEQVTWVLEQWRPSNVTLWDLDNGLCSLAPQAYGREWRWYVEVVEAAGNGWQPVSPPSAIGRFSWN